MNTKRDIEFLYEINCLRFISRSWVQMFGPNFSNLAEHHLRVIWLALLIAEYENKGDTGKIAKMALVHDVSESRAGDANYIGRLYIQRDQKSALADTFENTALKDEMLKLWDEYEKHKSIEAKIVKDADWLDVDMELKEQISKGETHLQNWQKERKLMLGKFYTKSAKKLFKAIWQSEPSDWYIHAKNRFTHGDFKPTKKSKK